MLIEFLHRYLFRLPNSNSNNNLSLLRQHAISFIRVTLLLSEMDVLIYLIIDELKKRNVLQHNLCSSIKYYLPAGIPLAHQKIEQCSLSLQRFQSSMQHCLRQLMKNREQLAQCSEQNLAIAEQLGYV